ncbi:MAG: hypothetical protein ACPGUD_10780 [Parashewanella sp.]
MDYCHLIRDDAHDGVRSVESVVKQKFNAQNWLLIFNEHTQKGKKAACPQFLRQACTAVERSWIRSYLNKDLNDFTLNNCVDRVKVMQFSRTNLACSTSLATKEVNDRKVEVNAHRHQQGSLTSKRQKWH